MNQKNKSKADYSFSHYKKVLQALKDHFDAHYVLSEIPQIFSQIMRPKFIIRHDIYESLVKGLELAKIEKEYSIRSSFMINTLSPHFNLKQEDHLSSLEQIIALGHEIGLYVHHTSSFVTNAEKQVLNENEIFSQCQHLESLTKKQVRSVSFPKEFSNLPMDSFFISQKVSASSKRLMHGALSDSSNPKEHRKLLTKIKNSQQKILQVLIHPELWHRN
jgi:hypothetical protein